MSSLPTTSLQNAVANLQKLHQKEILFVMYMWTWTFWTQIFI